MWGIFGLKSGTLLLLKGFGEISPCYKEFAPKMFTSCFQILSAASSASLCTDSVWIWGIGWFFLVQWKAHLRKSKLLVCPAFSHTSLQGHPAAGAWDLNPGMRQSHATQHHRTLLVAEGRTLSNIFKLEKHMGLPPSPEPPASALSTFRLATGRCLASWHPPSG